MKQTVYVDILVSVNIIVDYFLLYAAAIISGRKKERIRLCLAALLGGIGALYIFLPAMPAAVNILYAVILSLLMSLIAFGYGGRRAFIRTIVVFYSLSAAYSGLMLLLWSFSSVKNLSVNNGIVYINLDPAILIFATVIIYALLSLFSGRISSRNLHRTPCTVTIYGNGKHTDIDGLIDTGNVLTEPFSGLPVIIAEREQLRSILPKSFLHAADSKFSTSTLPKGIRLIPFRSVGGDGLYTAYLPERVDISLGGKRYRYAKVYIAISDRTDNTAIVNPDAINN